MEQPGYDFEPKNRKQIRIQNEYIVYNKTNTTKQTTNAIRSNKHNFEPNFHPGGHTERRKSRIITLFFVFLFVFLFYIYIQYDLIQSRS